MSDTLLSEYIVSAVGLNCNIIHVKAPQQNDGARVIVDRRGRRDADEHIVYRITDDQYLRLRAELRRDAVVEVSSTPDARAVVRQVDGRDLTSMQHEAGHFRVGDIDVAYDVLLDSFGRESWTLSIGFASHAALVQWSDERVKICTEFAQRRTEVVDGNDDALVDLWAVLQDPAALEQFDLDAWAAEHDIALQHVASTPPVRPTVEELRGEWQRLRQWTIDNSYFAGDEVGATESFLARSDYVSGVMRYAIEPVPWVRDDAVRFVVDRMDGRGGVEAHTADFVISSFISRNAVAEVSLDGKSELAS